MTKHLDGILLPEYRKLGFSICEIDDHILQIIRHGEVQATFMQNTTAQQLNDACEKLKGGSNCLSQG